MSAVKRILAIGSGKGGVGKSTVAWHMAHALKDAGLRVGLLDADIYGPSLPRFLGGYPQPNIVDQKIIPVFHDGLACMSIGLLMPSDQAAVWRGPMIMTAIKQLLHDVMWDAQGALDCLVVDLPPGTGDIPLTLSQKVNVDGAVIVTTPHPLAVDDAVRAEAMFERLSIPIVGAVHNMASMACASCQHINPLFEVSDQSLKSPTIGSLPFLPPYTQDATWQVHMAPIVQAVMAHLW